MSQATHPGAIASDDAAGSTTRGWPWANLMGRPAAVVHVWVRVTTG